VSGGGYVCGVCVSFMFVGCARGVQVSVYPLVRW